MLPPLGSPDARRAGRKRPLRGLRFGLVLLSFVASVACRRADPPVDPSQSSSSATTPAPSGSHDDPRWHAGRWREAGARRDLDLSRLAQAEGAAGLVEALEGDPAIASVALAALPHAPDALSSLEVVCAWMERPDRVALRRAALTSLLRVLEGRDRGLAPTPSSACTCRPRLARLAQEGPPAERDLAASAFDALGDCERPK